jgi:hypothetical protein
MRTMRNRKLQDVLFRHLGRDDQLLLAVVLCITECEHASRGNAPVLGVTTWHLFDGLTVAASDRRRGHPSIDSEWATEGELRAALVRLKKRGLLRGTVPADEESGASLWRQTAKAGAYLSERLLFRDAA